MITTRKVKHSNLTLHNFVSLNLLATTTTQPKKKKPLAERIKEKEEKKRLEKLAREEV